MAFLLPEMAPAQLLRKTSALAREKGAFYVEDATEREIRLTTKSESPVFSNLRGERRLGVIPAGRAVSVIAVSPTALRVRAKAVHDHVVGWIARSNATPLDEKLFTQLQAAAQRRATVDEYIARKEIAVGMTLPEVEAALGQPSERHSRVDGQGRVDTFDYITYRTISRQIVQYDQYGRPYHVFVPQKVETGRRSVDFVNGVVASFTENERLRRSGNGRLIPPPIIIEGGF